MADNKKLRGEPDRREVALHEDYEIEYFARLHKVSADVVRDLIRQYGNSRAVITQKLNELPRGS